MGELLLQLAPLIALLLTPFWGYLIWRRMRFVQKQANIIASPPERHGITPVEDFVKKSDDLIVTRPLQFDDDLALAEKRAAERSIQKDLEGRKY